MIRQIRILVLSAFLSMFAPHLAAQDAKTVLSATAKGLGGETVKSVRYTGSGSSYIVSSGPVPAGGWPHSVMKSYVHDLNLDRMTSKLQMVREEGTPPTAHAVNTTTDATSPWSSQYQFWITPHGFLRGTEVWGATVGSKTLYGTTYKTVTFTVPGNHNVVGYINEKNLLEKIETSVEDVAIEAQFHEYANLSGLEFPTMITEKQAGELSLILIVKDVQVTR
jgi:hypothetical protein